MSGGKERKESRLSWDFILCKEKNGLSRWLSGKEFACNVGDTGDLDLIPGLGKSPGEGTGTHSSILAWRIPWTAEPGGLWSIRSQRVGHYWIDWAYTQVAQRLKYLPAMWEIWVQSLGGEDPLEKEMATHSSILAWRIHGWRSLLGYSPRGRKESDTTERLLLHTGKG